MGILGIPGQLQPEHDKKRRADGDKSMSVNPGRAVIEFALKPDQRAEPHSYVQRNTFIHYRTIF